MGKKLILHIGTEKTGTTSIQHFLADNKIALEEQGIFIPQTPSGRSPNHRKLATACLTENQRDDSFDEFNIKNFPSWRDNAFIEISNELLLSNLETHVLSSEHFSSRLVGVEAIKRLYVFLKKIYSEIKVVIYFRRQDEYAVSLYSTYLKSGGDSKAILPKVPLNERFDYFSMCKKWEGVFGVGSLEVRVFDRSVLNEGNVISDFCQVLGINELHTKEAARETNPSLSPLAQEVLRVHNLLANAKDEESKLRWDLISYLELNYGGRPRLPKKSFLVEWYSQYEESNTALFESYFKSGSEFSADFSKYPDDWIDMSFSNEEYIELMLGFTKFMTLK